MLLSLMLPHQANIAPPFLSQGYTNTTTSSPDAHKEKQTMAFAARYCHTAITPFRRLDAHEEQQSMSFAREIAEGEEGSTSRRDSLQSMT